MDARRARFWARAQFSSVGRASDAGAVVALAARSAMDAFLAAAARGEGFLPSNAPAPHEVGSGFPEVALRRVRVRA